MGLTSVLTIGIMFSLKKDMAPPETIQIHFSKESVPPLIFGSAPPVFGLASPHPTWFDFLQKIEAGRFGNGYLIELDFNDRSWFADRLFVLLCRTNKKNRLGCIPNRLKIHEIRKNLLL